MRTHQVALPATVRSSTGTRAARRVRSSGQIPAVVYGRGAESVPLALDAATFLHAMPEANWYSTVITLRIEGAESDDSEPTVMIKEVQRDLVRRRLLSIDFQRISLQEKVHAQVPIIALGQSPGVKQGGILEHIVHEVTLESLPSDIPDHLEADISNLEIGDALRVGDLAVPSRVTVLASEDEVVLVIAPPLREEEVAPAPAEEEGAVVEEVEEPEVITEREAAEEES
jgi:large subunit ribosomal protein L25